MGRLNARVVSIRGGEHRGDVIAVLASQVVTLIAGLVAGIITARALGPTGRGVLGLALLVPLLLSLFLGFGSAIANVYLVASGRLSAQDLSAITSGLCLVGTVVGAAFIGSLWWSGALPHLLPHVSGQDLALAMVMLPLTLAYAAFRGLLRGLQNIRGAAAADAAQAVTTAVAIAVALIGLNGGVRGALIANEIAGLLSLATLWVLLRGRGLKLRPAFPREDTAAVVRLGVRSDLANLSQFFTYRLDSFLVNSIISATAVGLYAIATRLAELIWVMPSAIAAVVFPRAAAAESEILNEVTPRTFARALLISVVGAALLAALATVVIPLMYGARYHGAITPMLLLLPGVVVVGGASVLTNELSGRGHPGYNSINSLIGLALTIGLDVVLIPRYGISGAALASSIAYGVNGIVAVVFFVRVSQMGYRGLFRRMRLRG